MTWPPAASIRSAADITSITMNGGTSLRLEAARRSATRSLEVDSSIMIDLLFDPMAGPWEPVDEWSGFDVRYGLAVPPSSERQIQAPLPIIFANGSFDSDLRKRAYRNRVRMSESDHQVPQTSRIPPLVRAYPVSGQDLSPKTRPCC